MRERRFIQCDVFANVLMKGNGLAVVVDGEGLSEQTMQDFASWICQPETTFILSASNPEADYKVRIFTPSHELRFAGHPTLGSCAAWLHAGGRPKVLGTVVQECGIGNVIIDMGGALPGFVAPPTRVDPMPSEHRDNLLAVLKIAGPSVLNSAVLDNGSVWYALELESAAAILAVNAADVTGLPGLGIGLLGVSLLGADTQFEIRMLSDRTARYEDPITGALNAAMAVWLATQGRLTGPAVIAQGRKVGRCGRIHLLPDLSVPERILVAGQTYILVDGTVRL